MKRTEVRFGLWIGEGFRLYKDHIGPMILASLVAVVLGGITMGLLAGPMMAGLIFMALGYHDRRTPAPSAGHVFTGFNHFVQSFLFMLVWGIIAIVASLILNFIPVLGQLLSLVLVYVIQALLMFGLFLIVDRKMDFWAASMDSIRTVRANLWPFVGLGVAASVLGSIGIIVWGIGVVVTLPIQVCILTVAYREAYGTADEWGEPGESGREGDAAFDGGSPDPDRG